MTGPSLSRPVSVTSLPSWSGSVNSGAFCSIPSMGGILRANRPPRPPFLFGVKRRGSRDTRMEFPYNRAPSGRLSGPGTTCGAVAQLGERRVRNAKVEGSIPFRSTNSTGFAEAALRRHYDLPHLLVRFEEAMRLDDLVQLERARDHRLQFSLREPAHDQRLRTREALGIIPDRRSHPAADAQVLERRRP